MAHLRVQHLNSSTSIVVILLFFSSRAFSIFSAVFVLFSVFSVDTLRWIYYLLYVSLPGSYDRSELVRGHKKFHPAVV